jgi:hypothetical protein
VVPLLPVQLPLIVHGEPRSRRETLPKKLRICWTWISHSRVGGVINQSHWVGVQDIANWALAPQVSRSIGHIISHSECPKLCQSDSLTPHYNTRDMLARAKLDLPVIYASNFSYMGFGLRSLTGDELCSAFHIPNWMKPTPSELQLWLEMSVFSSMLPL